MSSSEEKRENGSAMLAIGWVLMLFSSLVFFFHPAALRLGQSRFAVVAVCLAVAGLSLAIVGTRMRRSN
jgi:hypothetical protein